MKTAEERAAEVTQDVTPKYYQRALAAEIARQMREYACDKRDMCAERATEAVMDMMPNEAPDDLADRAYAAVMSTPFPGESER